MPGPVARILIFVLLAAAATVAVTRAHDPVPATPGAAVAYLASHSALVALVDAATHHRPLPPTNDVGDPSPVGNARLGDVHPSRGPAAEAPPTPPERSPEASGTTAAPFPSYPATTESPSPPPVPAPPPVAPPETVPPSSPPPSSTAEPTPTTSAPPAESTSPSPTPSPTASDAGPTPSAAPSSSDAPPSSSAPPSSTPQSSSVPTASGSGSPEPGGV